ncbi:MAG: hypothetical protein RLZZ326_2971, partial [Planctomycetota bacterium]
MKGRNLFLPHSQGDTAAVVLYAAKRAYFSSMAIGSAAAPLLTCSAWPWS